MSLEQNHPRLHDHSGRRSYRAWLTKAIKTAFGAVIVGFIAYALYKSWPTVRSSIATVGPIMPVLGCGTLILSSLCQMAAWQFILRSLGSPRIPRSQSMATYFVSQMSKYVPGSIWPAVIQSQFGKRFGVPPATMYSSFFVQLAISVATAAILSPLVYLGPGESWIRWASIGAFCAGLVLMTLIFRQDLLKQAARAIRPLKRLQIPDLVSTRDLAIGVSFVLASWTLAGVQVWLLSAPLGADALQLPFVIGANTLSWVVGLVIVILPAGAGAREAVVVLTLGVVLGPTQALTVAVLSRFIQIVADLVLTAAFGWPALRRVR